VILALPIIQYKNGQVSSGKEKMHGITGGTKQSEWNKVGSPPHDLRLPFFYFDWKFLYFPNSFLFLI
jgi:hypothetical protein